MIATAYLAADGFERQLAEELERLGVRVEAWHGRLALSAVPPVRTAWALDVWLAPAEFQVTSIKAAADALRQVQRNWSLYAAGHHRRCALIEARLPPVRPREIMFPQAAPTSHLGAWTLLSPERLLASPIKTSPYPNGAITFAEDHIAPPSRAYLKLWEAWTRIAAWPSAGETCLDLGAAPGGWTWAAAKLGARVTAIDRAPLSPSVLAMPGVRFQSGSAFAVEPFPVDWLLSDVIAYPGRLLSLAQRWIEADAPARIVCTVKLQGKTDHAAVEAFGSIPGGSLMHLNHNKHELTFVWRKPAQDFSGSPAVSVA